MQLLHTNYLNPCKNFCTSQRKSSTGGFLQFRGESSAQHATRYKKECAATTKREATLKGILEWMSYL